MQKNFVLIDYENVHPRSVELLAHESFHVKLFVGAHQTKLPIDMVVSIQRLGERAEYVKMSGNGTNSLDFHIAYYLGVLSETNRHDRFFIVSRDTGFDPLVQFLKGKKIDVRRVTALAEISAATGKGAPSGNGQAALFAQKLAEPKVTKPRTLTTLSRSVASFFQQQLSDDEVGSIVAELIERRVIAVDGQKVEYLNGNA